MKVYVLETGVYEQRDVVGVYDTPERAMAQADGAWTRSTSINDDGAVAVIWDNDQDWGAAASVYEYELQTSGPVQSVDHTSVQVYRPLDGGWAYLSESAEAIQLARDAHETLLRHRDRGVWKEPEPTEIDRRIAALADLS